MKFENTFGETVKKLREEKKLTLREVAKELKIDTSMLGKIEKNTRKPTMALIKQFSRLFSVNDKDLKVAFLSDIVSYQIMDEEDVADQVLKVAERKLKYLKMNKKSKS
jgi:transcriptional regulator with XRE-family HTH domain